MQTQEIVGITTLKTENESSNEECKDIGNLSEIWKPIENFDRYECSNLGNFRYFREGQYINSILRLTHAGYFIVNLYNGKSKTYTAHRIVAKTFLPNPSNYPIINHIDGVKTNNAISNLEWCSYEHNNRHAFDLGLKNDMIGENNISHKLKWHQIREIRREYLEGNVSYLELSKKYDIAYVTISRIIKNRIWRDENCNQEYFDKLNKVIHNRHSKIAKLIRTKLNYEQAEQIRQLYLSRKNSMRQLAKMFDISMKSISNIIKNKILPNEKYNISEDEILKIREENRLKSNKLKKEDILIIKSLFSRGMSQPKIGNLFGVSQTRISQIILGKHLKTIS